MYTKEMTLPGTDKVVKIAFSEEDKENPLLDSSRYSGPVKHEQVDLEAMKMSQLKKVAKEAGVVPDHLEEAEDGAHASRPRGTARQAAPAADAARARQGRRA